MKLFTNHSSWPNVFLGNGSVQKNELIQQKKDKYEIDANIYVSKQSQKSIVIGKNGDKIKSIGTSARIDHEKKLNKKVFLRLWCKVQKNWVNNPISLESFGIKS